MFVIFELLELETLDVVSDTFVLKLTTFILVIAPGTYVIAITVIISGITEG